MSYSFIRESVGSMQIIEKCPFCHESSVFNQIHKTLKEKTVKNKYLKYKCLNCSTEIYSHKTHRDVKMCHDR